MRSYEHNSAIFDEAGVDDTDSDSDVPVEADSGCVGCNIPFDNPGGGSTIHALAVTTEAGPRVGPEVGPVIVSPDMLWLVPQVSCTGR